MKDEIQTIFHIDPAVASSEDLDSVVKQAEKLLETAKSAKTRALKREEKSALQAKKRAYGPVIPIYRKEYRWHEIVKNLQDVIKQSGSISEDVFYKSIKHHGYTLREDKSLVWRCPKCGSALYLNHVENLKYQVTCSGDNCKWACPRKCGTKCDAWDEFENWLKKNGWYNFEETSIKDPYFEF